MSKSIKSPLVLNGETSIIDVFNVSQICEAYKNLGVDVTRLFENVNEVQLYECKSTGYRFFYPFTTIGDAEFYKDLSLTRENYYSQRWEHLIILNELNASEKILEIGSGFGIFLKLLKEKNIMAEGLELNPKAISVCSDEGLIIHDELIKEFSNLNLDKYDVVCSFQVLEHITNVHDFIRYALQTLKPNGKLIFGVPNNNPYLFVNDKYHTLNLPPHHAGLWNKKAFEALTDIFDIEIEKIRFEPLEKSYSQFIKSYIRNSNHIKRSFLILCSKIMPGLLKRLLCKFINGRNILVVFKKK